MVLTRKCWIIKEWECNIEADEIPLEVCRLCAETRLKLEELKRRAIKDE